MNKANKRRLLEKKTQILKLKEKRNRLLREKMESDPKYTARKVYTLLEAEIERAELILAAKDIVNQLQDIAEKVAKIQIEDIMPIVDQMRGEFSPEQADAFDNAANEQLGSALEGIKTAREQMNSQVLQLEGKIDPSQATDMANDLGADDEDETDLADSLSGDDDEGEFDLGGDEGDEDEDGEDISSEEVNDIFGNDDEGEPDLGRAKKESFRRHGRMIKEGKKKVSERVNAKKKGLDKVYESQLRAAVTELLENIENGDSFNLTAELIADKHGVELDELSEGYKRLFKENRNKKFEYALKKARTPGLGLREALNITERRLDELLPGLTNTSTTNNKPAAVDQKAKTAVDKVVKRTTAPTNQEISRAKTELKRDRTVQDAAKDLGLDPEELADKAVNNKLGIEEAILEDKSFVEATYVDDYDDMDPKEASGIIKDVIANVKSGKGIEAKDTFSPMIKVTTPTETVKNMLKRFGDPEGWDIVEDRTYNICRIMSQPFPRDKKAEELQKERDSLQKEADKIRNQHSDVKDGFRLPQEIKIGRLNNAIEAAQRGYPERILDWLNREEATAFISLAKHLQGN